MRTVKIGDYTVEIYDAIEDVYKRQTFVEIPISDGDKQPDMRNPVQMLTVDRSSLDYNVEEEKRLKNDIITSVVGTNEEIRCV